MQGYPVEFNVKLIVYCELKYALNCIIGEKNINLWYILDFFKTLRLKTLNNFELSNERWISEQNIQNIDQRVKHQSISIWIFLHL